MTRRDIYLYLPMHLALMFLLSAANVYVAELRGVISSASHDYLMRTIAVAEKENALCLIVKLDTPGGLDVSMREMTKRILNAEIPIVVYVAPRGARAASAGVFLLYASHIAAMSPGTNVGAAHPVSAGGEKMDSIMAEKVTNDAVAYLVSLAKERKRNVRWAEQAVRSSASIDAEEAKRINVCEIIASDLDELIAAINGRRVEINNKAIIVEVGDYRVRNMPMTLRDRLLLLLTNPTIAYILLIFGVYGLFFELQRPGMIFPGVVGGICLILGLYALHLLPVNYAGVALIVLSAILFILEIHITSHGLLTIGGVVALASGSVILFESDVPFLRISWEVIVVTVVVIAGFFLLLLILGISAQFRKPVSGREGMVGEIGVALTDITDKGGTVYVHGEYWQAFSKSKIKKGDKAKVIAVQQMTLEVASA